MMGIKEKAIATAADLARVAFDYALEKVATKAKQTIPAYVTRDDFEQALIELQFHLMDMRLADAELQHEQHEQRMQALRDRLAEERAAGDIPDTVIVDPTGDEPTTKPYQRDGDGDD